MTDIGLLLLRIGVGLMMAIGHGWGKVLRLGQDPIQFGDPLGIGVVPSLILAAGAEFVCSIALILGVFTRLAAIPLLITMLVAAGIAHAADPWQKKELAALFALVFLTLILTGGGRYGLTKHKTFS